jgi:hypothetical protein
MPSRCRYRYGSRQNCLARPTPPEENNLRSSRLSFDYSRVELTVADVFIDVGALACVRGSGIDVVDNLPKQGNEIVDFLICQGLGGRPAKVQFHLFADRFLLDFQAHFRLNQPPVDNFIVKRFVDALAVSAQQSMFLRRC